MITARDVMIDSPEYVDRAETIGAAAVKMRDLRVRALPICDDMHSLTGVLTERDIVVGCIAGGADPYTAQVSDYAEDVPVTVRADDSIESALFAMAIHHVRRIPVIDGRSLVGMLHESDVARSLSDSAATDLLVCEPREPMEP